jgi:DNA-binding PadR family transcriptional regulator
MILGLVRWLQPVHGYDVRRELLSWSVEDWANIAPGSIYHALRKLSQEQMLEEVATEQVGARPARTTYRVTAKGDAEFTELLRRYWWEYRQPVDPFLSAFALLPALPRREASAALRNRVRLLEEYVAALRVEVTDLALATSFKPPHVGWLLELNIARGETEIAWCGRIADRIDGGAGLHVGEFDEQQVGAQWREAIAKEFDPADGSDNGR